MRPEARPDDGSDADALRRQLREYERWFRTLDRQVRLLERERRKFSAVVHHTDAGFLLLDPDRKVVWSNEVFGHRYRGVGRGSTLVGRTCNQVLCGADEICRECPAHGPFDTGRVAHHEMSVRLDGRDRHLYATAMPVQAPEGGTEQVIIMLQDVSDLEILRLSEEALRASESRFRSIFENVASGMHTCRPDGSLLEVNPAFCEMLGYTRTELLARGNVRELTHPDDREQTRVQFEEVRAGRRQVMELELRYLHKDGRTVWGRTTAVWLRDDAGELDYAVVLVQDITERMRAKAELRQSRDDHKRTREALLEREEQLQHSQKMEAIGRLAGGIAHDFNNLLTAISGYSRLMLRRLSGNDPLRREAAEITRAADRAASLTGQLLAFSRRQVLSPKVLDLNAVVEETNRMLRRVIGEDIDLATVMADDLGRVRADPGQIQQVLLNLAVNARDAMPLGGRLTIQTCNTTLDSAEAAVHPTMEPGRFVKLSVSDTGCGMDPETRAKVFEPFFTTKDVGKGTGLGLSTVYGIIKQSGGHIWVYSEIGSGTTFEAYLPRVDAELDQATGAPVAVEDGTVGTETVLLVEDDEAVRALVQEVLEEAGYTVLEACSGAEALALSEDCEAPIQLLVTDLVMPQMGGAELSKQLQPVRPEMRVLFISGYTDSAVFHQGLLEPGSHFMQKPFTPDSLISKVREILDAG